MLRRFAFVPLALPLLVGLACDDESCPDCPEGEAIIFLTTDKIDFGSTGTTAVFTIVNKGEKTLSWDLTEEAPWLELSQSAGNDDANITVTIDREEMETIGVYRETIVVSSNAVNTQEDYVEVFALNSGQWLITDTNEADSCRVVGANDFYWVKGFTLPSGVETAMIDSVSLYFCDADTIQLIAFSATRDGIWFPSSLLYLSAFIYEVEEGWNTLPSTIYLTEKLFYVGYVQINPNGPQLGIDGGLEEDSVGSRRAFDPPDEPGDTLFWQQDPALETFLIRAFISPVFEYNPKLASQTGGEAEHRLREIVSRRSDAPADAKPLLR
jgi:hypothetical protein